MPYGTLSITDLLSNQATIAQIGEDVVFESIQTALDAHNQIVREQMTDLVEISTDRIRRYGGLDTMQMDEIDEYGAPDAQKVTAGTNVGFPLKLFGTAVQWTRKFTQVATASELAEQFVAAQDADVRQIIAQIKKALFVPTNSNPIDRLVQNALVLPVKALINADGAVIPPNPITGATFNGATHTHYLAVATGGTIATTDVTALTTTVLEHYGMGELRIYANQAQEAALRALTGFVAYIDPRIISATTITTGRAALDVANLYDRRIGIYGPAEVWVKPWVPANYLFCFDSGVPKTLVMRERFAGTGDLVIAAEDEEYPLRARRLEREFGVGVWNRGNGAVMEVDATSYTAPVIKV
jgi:hypothetical protein